MTKPDSPQEKLTVTAPEDNIQLAALLQSMINIFAFASQGNIQVLQDLMLAMRVAAEEAISINKFDKDDKQVKQNQQ